MIPLTDPLAIAQALIRCPSVTPDDAGAIDALIQALTRLGFVCHDLIFDSAGIPIRNLYARLGTSEPNICFAGHTDVVPPGQPQRQASGVWQPGACRLPPSCR